MNNLNSTNIDDANDLTRETVCYTVAKDEVKKRIDVLLSSYPEVNSRTFAQRLLKEGRAEVNGQRVSPKYKARLGDQISFSIPEPQTLDAVPEAGELEILFEDSSLIVINKPAGLVVHPAPGHSSGTLVNFLLHHCQDLSGIGGVARPGIVHRLDKDTSGVLVVAKTDRAHTSLSLQFHNHSIQRKYKALLWGQPQQNHGSIQKAIGRHPVNRKKMAVLESGKEATTHWKVITRFKHFTLLECRLETGRTHQIRVHFSSENMPLLGDPLYCRYRLNRLSSSPPPLLKILSLFNRQALHAQELGFKHPVTGEFQQFNSSLPADFETLLHALKKWD
ncbi:MAG: RluA family pseudouridine synthase [SAR324 cluster bacterium]|nr:RluA family pseudouridine synthase [SAR324 cluster bacterium]